MKTIISIFLTVFLFVSAYAQKNLTIEETVLNRTKLAPSTLKQLQWIKGTTNYSWVRTNLGAEELVSSSGDGNKVKVLVTLMEMNAKIKASNLTSLPQELVFPTITWIDPNRFTFESRDYTVTYDVKNKSVSALLRPVFPDKAEHKEASPAGNMTAFTVENNLFIMKDGKQVQVTNDANAGIVNGQSVHRDEFGIMKGTFWSPSGKLLAFYRMDQTMVTEYPIMEIGSLPATARMIRYPMAGAKSHHVTLGVYNTETGKTIFLNTGEPVEQYLTNIVWSPDNKSIYIAIVNREQNHMKMNRYNAATGAFEATLFEEKNEKWVQPMDSLMFVPGHDDQFVWQSERDGYNALYLYKTDGTLISQLTSTSPKDHPLIVTKAYGFSPAGDVIYFQGAEAGDIERHVFSVELKKGIPSLRLLTPAFGTSSATFSDDFSQFIYNFSSNTTPRLIGVKKSDGKESGVIHKASNPLEGYNTCGVKLFTITSADGKTPLWCRMILPAGFDSTKKYPTLTYVYNGPNVQMVTNTWLGGADLFLYYMAQQGFVVFTVDGRGSDNRGIEFAQAIFRHLGTQEIADQKMGSNYLKSKSYVDGARMAVYGWSYGGFMTTSMMTRTPGVYKCGVAGGAVIDWNFYEVMYTERYMDTPKENPEGYKESNTMNYVKNLQGKLLMIHGTSDDVVVWQHTMAYTKAAVDSGVQTDYYMYPGHLHNVRGKDRVHLLTKIAGYIISNT